MALRRRRAWIAQVQSLQLQRPVRDVPLCEGRGERPALQGSERFHDKRAKVERSEATFRSEPAGEPGKLGPQAAAAAARVELFSPADSRQGEAAEAALAGREV